MVNFKKIQYGLFVVAGFLVFLGPVLAQPVNTTFPQPRGITTEVPLPSIEGTEPFKGPAQYVAYIFRLSLGIAAALAFAMIVVGGIQIALSGGNVSQVEDGKDRIRMAILGFLLLLFSILILRTIGISAISNPPLPSVSIPPTPTGSPPPPPPPVSGTLEQVAIFKERLDSVGRVTYRATGGCVGQAGFRSTAAGNNADFRARRYPYVCSCTCNCQEGGPSGNITINPVILNGMYQMASFFPIPITITSFTGDQHSCGSMHYRGRAVDFVPNASFAVWQNIVDFLNSRFGGDARCERGGVRVNCLSGNPDHIHWTSP